MSDLHENVLGTTKKCEKTIFMLLFLQFVGETQDWRAQRVTLFIRTKLLKKEIIIATIKNIIPLSKVIY